MPCKGIDFDEFVDYLFGLYTSEPTCLGWITIADSAEGLSASAQLGKLTCAQKSVCAVLTR